MFGLDLSFFDLEMLRKFVLQGFIFSVQLTVIATLGGIVFGTLLALMRLSGQKWLMWPAAVYVNVMRSIPLVMVILWFYLLMPFLIGRPIGAELSAVITFVVFEAAYFSEISGIGLTMHALPAGDRRIGVIGLGAGTLAAYPQPGDYLHMYEINPDVLRLASKWFTYLTNCQGK